MYMIVPSVEYLTWEKQLMILEVAVESGVESSLCHTSTNRIQVLVMNQGIMPGT